MTVRVAVADDQHLIRVGLRGIIAAAPDLVVVGEAANGAEAVDLARRLRPDVLLMDVRMPVMDGIAATRLVTASTPVRVVVLTTFDLDEYIWSAIEAGASGFLLKDSPATEIQDAVRAVAAGDALLSPSVTRRVLTRLAVAPRDGAGDGASGGASSRAAVRLRGVTARELEVLGLVAQGLSNAEIAGRLHVTPGTVKTHVSNLLTKLDARDRIQLVILALTDGLAPG